MAVRYYNHAGYVGGMPVDAEARQHWTAAGTSYVRRAGMLYSWGLRQLVLVVPLVAFILHPLAGVVGSLIVIGAPCELRPIPRRSSFLENVGASQFVVEVP
jgi:hypothetical protein